VQQRRGFDDTGRQVCGAQVAARASGAVVPDAGGVGGAAFLDHQPGRGVGVGDGVHGQSLGAQLAGDFLAEAVVTDAPDPSGRGTQALQRDGEIASRAADPEGEVVGVRERAGGVYSCQYRLGSWSPSVRRIYMTAEATSTCAGDCQR
jgi:hypothetical protein